MKKKWAYLAATLLLAGCAEDAFEDVNMQETTELQEIKLFAGTAGLEVESRGAGTVGGLVDDAAANVWKGQKLTIWGIKKGADLTSTDNNIVVLAGAEATAPSNASSGTVTLTDGLRYYPLQGAFNFTGYYIDDAANGEVARTATAITQAVEIDGSQDIMIAKAELTGAQKVTLVESLIEYEKLDGPASTYVETADGPTKGEFVSSIADDDKALIEKEYEKAFSSYTARREVQPEMTFQHQLARLEFSVIAGDENAMGSATEVTVDGESYTKGILINGITIKKAQKHGIIKIDNVGNITFEEDESQVPTETDVLTLKNNLDENNDGDLDELTKTAPENLYDKNATENVYTRVGESILAFPEDIYTADINTIQYVQLKKGTTDQYETLIDEDTEEVGKKTAYTDVTIKLSGEKTFEAGKTYAIKVKVYSNQEIVITATLQGWEKGDDVDISPEDDLFDQEFNSSTNSGTNSGTGTTTP